MNKKEDDILHVNNFFIWNQTIKNRYLKEGRTNFIAEVDFDTFYGKRVKSNAEKMYDDKRAALGPDDVAIAALEEKYHSAIISWSNAEAKARDEWAKGEASTRGDLLLHVDKMYWPRLEKLTTAKAMWDEIQKVGEGQQHGGALSYVRGLYSDPMRGGESYSQFISRFRENADKLEKIGLKVPDEILALLVLSQLPKEAEPLVMNLAQLDKAKLTLDEMQKRLEVEDTRVS